MGLITRFFQVPFESYADGKAIIKSNKDILPLDLMTDVTKLYDFDDGTTLIHVVIKRHAITAMMDMAELDDPLSMAGVLELGLEDTYVGMDYSNTPYVGLFWFLPELAGTKTIDDGEGSTVEVDIVPRHTWGASL